MLFITVQTFESMATGKGAAERIRFPRPQITCDFTLKRRRPEIDNRRFLIGFHESLSSVLKCNFIVR